MPTVFKTYATESAASRAVQALGTAGVPRRHIRLVRGCRLHDIRREPVGGFAGPVGPSARVGRFSGDPRPRWRWAGAFIGDPDGQRRGSYGDVDRCVIVTYGDDGERPRLASERDVRRLAQRSAASQRIADELELGRTVVLVEVAALPSAAQTWVVGGARRAEAGPARPRPIGRLRRVPA